MTPSVDLQAPPTQAKYLISSGPVHQSTMNTSSWSMAENAETRETRVASSPGSLGGGAWERG